MAITSREYWEKRKARELYERLEKAEETAEELRAVYYLASQELQEEARKIAKRFQLKHNLTEAEARRLLATLKSPEEINRLTARLRQNPNNQELAAELESAAYAARIKRLMGVYQMMDDVAMDLYNRTQPAFAETLREIANQAYYQEIFGLQQQAEAAFPFAKLDPKFLEDLINTRWSGKNFSERLWGNTQALADSVKTELLIGLLTGKSQHKIARAIDTRVGVDFNATRRLIRTEANYVDNQAAMSAYKEAGITKYIYVATLDLRTSEVCRGLDRKTFKVDKAIVGVNYPPMHPWCRSTTIAWIHSEPLRHMKRAAIDPKTGKTITVPASMSYEKWYNTYVGGKPPVKKKKPAPDVVPPMDWPESRELIELKRVKSDIDSTIDVTGKLSYKDDPNYPDAFLNVSLAKQVSFDWNDLSQGNQARVRAWARTDHIGRPTVISKADLKSKMFDWRKWDPNEKGILKTSLDEPVKVLENAGYKVIGYNRLNKYGFVQPVILSEKEGKVFLTLGYHPGVRSTISPKTLDKIQAREKAISDKLWKEHIRFRSLTARKGDDWSEAMTKFHTAVEADDRVLLVSKEAYDKVKGEELYRGIAPQSHLRSDLSMTKTPMQCAKQLMEGGVGDCFPSRGIYGDCIAYLSNSKNTGFDYATGYGDNPGGVITRMKIRDDARKITYNDAMKLFNDLNGALPDGPEPYFSKNQARLTNGVEVGKAMQLLGYDYIYEPHGDGMRVHFYMILNRSCLVAIKDDWVEVEITPEILRRRKW